jgi:hypothetical protein
MSQVTTCYGFSTLYEIKYIGKINVGSFKIKKIYITIKSNGRISEHVESYKKGRNWVPLNPEFTFHRLLYT